MRSVFAKTGAEKGEARSDTAFEDVRKYGAKVDGITSDLAALQRALDTAPFGSTIYIPPGVLRVTKATAAQANYCLLLTRQVNIWCDGLIRADLAGSDVNVDLLKIAVAQTSGNLDVRNQTFRLRTVLNGGGRSAVRVEAALPVIRMFFTGGGLHGLAGPALFCGGDMQGTVVEGNQIDGGVEFGGVDGVYHADNVIVRDNTIFGKRPGVVLDMIEGAYSHTIQSNTIVCRDGAVHVRNGSQVKIRDNQFEQFPGYGANSHRISCSVLIDGSRYAAESCDITGNNFGGGTNVRHNLVLANANKTVVESNDFHSAAAADIVFTSQSMSSTIGVRNRYRGPWRTGSGYAALKFEDSGLANTGLLKSLAGVLNNNGWSCENGTIIVIDGVAHLSGTLVRANSATVGPIGTLPVGYRPRNLVKLPVFGSRGFSDLTIQSNGQIRLGNASNASIPLTGVSYLVAGLER